MHNNTTTTTTTTPTTTTTIFVEFNHARNLELYSSIRWLVGGWLVGWLVGWLTGCVIR
jgi:hypothetical protein